MHVLSNPHRGRGLADAALAGVPWPSTDAARPAALLARCPAAGATPLVASPSLALALGVAEVHVKDERARMGLGSFKALGAAYVIACDAEAGLARGAAYIAASAGNHGLSVAAGAQAFGARALIYLSRQVPEPFARRLQALGAEVVRAGDDYEASMQAAAEAAEAQGAVLLSDSSWPGYVDRPHRLMEGYLVLMAETFDQIPGPPTHILLQAGVGGLAAAAAALARDRWGDAPCIVVVEPEAAPALIASIEAGAPVDTRGPSSCMGRLDCKSPSLIALKGLARDADAFAAISEGEGRAGAALVARHDLASTPSGAAGLAAVHAAALQARARLGITAASRLLAILSEAPE